MAENQILHEGRFVTVGAFRCPPQHPRWHGMNVNGDEPLAAFPETSVVIHHVGRDPILANPNHVVFYGPGTQYRRELHDDRGDRCVFVTLRGELLADLLQAAGLNAASDEIPFGHGPSDAAAYLRLRVAAHATASGAGEELQLEEAVYGAVSSALRLGAQVHATRRRASRARTEIEHHRLVEEAKTLLTERASNRDSLEALARTLHTSAFHLGHLFRARTGFSMHAYRTHLRLRLALDRLRDETTDISSIAMELGFNSHSHFTGAFRSVFRVTPSEVRAALSGGLVRELRKTVEAPLLSPSP